MFEHERFKIMLCCNDHRNGIFAHRLSGLEIGPNMTFESTCRYESDQRDDGGVPSLLKYIDEHFTALGKTEGTP